jgi:hypothetical protein
MVRITSVLSGDLCVRSPHNRAMPIAAETKKRTLPVLGQLDSIAVISITTCERNLAACSHQVVGRGGESAASSAGAPCRQASPDSEGLGLFQNGMLERLGFETSIGCDYISAYERGKREPPLPVLLEYARASGVSMESLVDDELDLPKRLPKISVTKGWTSEGGPNQLRGRADRGVLWR